MARRNPRDYVRGPAPFARGSRFFNPKDLGIDREVLLRAMRKVNPGQFFHVQRIDRDYAVMRAPVLGEGKPPEWMEGIHLPDDYEREGDARAHAEALNKQLEKHGKLVSGNANYKD